MRRLLRILAYAGLMLSLFTAAVWVRSIWRLDQIQWDTDPHPLPPTPPDPPMISAKGYDIRTSAGGLLIFWSDKRAPAKSYRKPIMGRYFTWGTAEWPEYPYTLPQVARIHFHFGGFEVATQESSFPSGSNRTRLVTTPLWFVIVVLAAPGVVMLRRDLRHRRRIKAGCCTICGYDLRASRDQCPECGEPISSGPA